MRAECSYDTLDVFPVFQVEGDGYLPTTSLVTPPGTGNLATSPATLGPDSLLPEAMGSFNSFIGGQATARSFIESTIDLSQS